MIFWVFTMIDIEKTRSHNDKRRSISAQDGTGMFIDYELTEWRKNMTEKNVGKKPLGRLRWRWKDNTKADRTQTHTSQHTKLRTWKTGRALHSQPRLPLCENYIPHTLKHNLVGYQKYELTWPNKTVYGWNTERLSMLFLI